MNQNEFYYRKTIGAIGSAMLVFFLLFQLFGIFIVVFTFAAQLFLMPLGQVVYDVVYQLVYGIGYLAIFLIPIAFLKLFIQKNGYPYRPLMAKTGLSKYFPLCLFGGVLIIFGAAYFNSILLEPIGYSDFLNEMMGETEGAEPYRLHEILLQVFVVCIVPGFCEEFLFRGAIMTNCMPFGKVPAILISSLLFAVMHQNAGQILYAFCAGIFLGVLYEKTGNIWNCVLLHTLNNFISTMETVMARNIQDPLSMSTAITVLEGGIMIFGAISLILLALRIFAKKDPLEKGFFEKSLPVSDGYAAYPVEHRRMVSLFCAPTMILFLVFVTIQILFLIGMAVMRGVVLPM